MKYYLKLLRPKQWVKNGLIFASLFFSQNMFNVPLLLDTLSAFVIFCMISSATYILNDTVDREKDRQHPKKCKRPIASGKVSVGSALVVMVFLIVGSVVWAYVLNKSLCYVVLGYFALNISYSFYLKHIPILDMMTIAAGFLLRVIAGNFLISYAISPWLLVCTLLLSLFLALHKRKSELGAMNTKAGQSRSVLQYYTEEMLRDMLSMISATTIMAYSLYTFTSEQSSYMMLSIPFVIYGMFRYQYIIHHTELGESPELALLTDAPLLVCVVLWGLTCGGIIYFL